MLKTQGVVHFTIPVKDLDRAERFYTEVMGMERLRRTGQIGSVAGFGLGEYCTHELVQPGAVLGDGRIRIELPAR